MAKIEIRFAHIGCGRVGQRFIHVFGAGEVPGARMSNVCDLDTERAAAAGRRLNARTWQDMSRMLAEATDIDCVTIATPSGSHAEHARAALEAGKHVIVEKPITMRPEEALELDELARSKGLMYGVIKQSRYNPAMRTLKSAVDAGRFGTPVLGTVRVRWSRDMSYYSGDGWRGKFATDGGVITNQSIHHIDALQWIMGPVEAVCAHGMARLSNIEADDTTVAILRFASGASGAIEATTAARPIDIEASLSILGSGGSAVIGGLALNEIQFWKFAEPLDEDATIPANCSQIVPNAYGFGHAPLMRDVTEALRRGEIEAPIGAVEGVKSLAIVHALYRSMEVGGWVPVDAHHRSQRLGIGPGALI